MVPEETQEVTDHLPRAHTKSSITQPHVPEMVTSTNGHNEGVCDTVMPQAPDEEDNRRSNDANTILDRGMFEVLTFPFPGDPSSTLDIQVSTNSDQGAQSTCFSPSSSELLTSRAASSEPPNISNGGSAAETSTPNNPQTPFPFFTDPYEYELEKLRREKESVKKKFEEKTSELMAELERKMDEARSEFDKKSREADAEYKARALEDEAKKRFLEMSNLLASAYMYKTTDTSDLAALRAKISSIQQQQPLHMDPTAPPGPSVTVTEAAPIPNPSGGGLSHSPRGTTTQLSQQGGVQTNTHMDPASSPPGLSATATEAAPFPNPSGGLSQQAQVQTNTHMDATSPPPGLSATATEAAAPFPNLSGSLSHFPRANRTQRRNTRTHVTSTALSPPPLPPTVTAAEASVPNPPGRPRSRGTTSQPRLTTSQQAAGQTSTALSLHSPLSNTARPRPPPVISNLTPSSPSPLGLGLARGPAPHVKPFRASPATIKTYQRTRFVQIQQQQGNSNGGLVYLSDDDE